VALARGLTFLVSSPGIWMDMLRGMCPLGTWSASSWIFACSAPQKKRKAKMHLLPQVAPSRFQQAPAFQNPVPRLKLLVAWGRQVVRLGKEKIWEIVARAGQPTSWNLRNLDPRVWRCSMERTRLVLQRLDGHSVNGMNVRPVTSCAPRGGWHADSLACSCRLKQLSQLSCRKLGTTMGAKGGHQEESRRNCQTKLPLSVTVSVFCCLRHPSSQSWTG